MKKSVSHVPALARGLKILEWMAGREEPATLTQIAQGMNLGIPEVQRPVACLADTGYLRHLSSGAYILSGRLFVVANHHPPQLRLRRTAEPALLNFARTTGQSIHLSIPDGDAALMILDVPGEGLVRLGLQPGARLAPNDTLSGAILAVNGTLPAPLDFSPPKGLREAIRTKKPFHCKSQQVVGVVDLGMLLQDSDERVLGVLTASIITPKSVTVNLPHLCNALERTAVRLRETL